MPMTTTITKEPRRQLMLAVGERYRGADREDKASLLSGHSRYAPHTAVSFSATRYSAPNRLNLNSRLPVQPVVPISIGISIVPR